MLVLLIAVLLSAYVPHIVTACDGKTPVSCPRA